ncbi:glycosyltransferase [Candidatus Bathyarchaeota archaeon]|nr:glycosyltransferase [Candidatus Bathyarchaeota archaeon]
MDSPKQPLVSVIVPTYNSQKTIKQCLQSIKNQTYKEIETIVIDRHSKDQTIQIAKKYKTKLLYVTEERSTLLLQFLQMLRQCDEQPCMLVG